MDKKVGRTFHGDPGFTQDITKVERYDTEHVRGSYKDKNQKTRCLPERMKVNAFGISMAADTTALGPKFLKS